MTYKTPLEELKKIVCEAAKDGGPRSESGATNLWGLVIATALFAQTERLEAIAEILERPTTRGWR